MRRAILFSLPGILLIMLVLRLHAVIQRQLRVPTAAPVPTASPTEVPVPTETPAPPASATPVPPTAVPTLTPTPQPTAPAKPTATPQPQATPVPPTPTPIPGPIITNDKLGVGVYTSGIPYNVLVTMRPAMILLQDPDIRTVVPLRQYFPKALIVGRHYVPDGDFSLARCNDANEDHHAKGVAFADMLARGAVPLKNVVDAWVSDNEQTDHNHPEQYACHAAFQSGFIETMQGKYGIDAVAGNDAVGVVEPADYPKYFAKPISEAKYFGVHAYGRPETLNLQADAQYYALRYRLIHDALVGAGVPLPQKGFLLTESGLYQGWRGYVSDQEMANQFIWLEQQTEQDSYLKGQFVFGIGPQTRFGNYEIMGTTMLELLGQFNAQHAGKA